MSPRRTLLAILPFDEPKDFAARIRARYPHIDVVWVKQAYGITTWDSTDSFDRGIFRDADILCTLSAIPTPEEAPELKLIQLLPAGVDHLLREPIFQRPDVRVTTSSGIHAPQIAEWVALQILFFNHHSRYFDAMQQRGRWVSHAEVISTQGRVKNMTSVTVGILGYGSIGRQVARVCHSMGSKVIAFTASPRETVESRHDSGFCLPGTGDPEGILPSAWYHGLSKEAVHEFLQQGLDVLVVTLPLTENTHHLLGEDEFRILSQATKDAAMVINVSRGAIVDQAALIARLKLPVTEGGLRGAALDVTDPEPLPSDHELWHLPNVVLHPHVSALTDQREQRFLKVVEDNVARFENGEPLLNLVQKQRGY